MDILLLDGEQENAIGQGNGKGGLENVNEVRKKNGFFENVILAFYVYMRIDMSLLCYRGTLLQNNKDFISTYKWVMIFISR